jgi:hypothetical protein
MGNLISIFYNQSFFILIARLLQVNFIFQFIIKLFIIKKKDVAFKKFNNFLDTLNEIDFADLRLYHTYNYIDPSGSWIFNHVDQGRAWPSREKNREDYTRDLVFCYLEWLFSNKYLMSREIENIHVRQAITSVFWNEPSAKSLSLYPLLWAAHKKKFTNEYIFDLLFDNFSDLIRRIEFGVGANHLIDNFLSLSIYSLFLGSERSQNLFLSIAVRLLKKATKNGYYAEKTPIYALGLAIRCSFVCSVFSSKTNSRVCREEVNEIIEKLLNFPKVHLNDSYLPLDVLKQNYQISKNWRRSKGAIDYFIHKSYKNIDVYLVTNGVGSRGYRGHAHDSSMSLFVDSTSFDGIYVGGFGTAEYSNTKLRSLGKQGQSYPSIRGQNCRVLKSSGSFRVERIYEPKLRVVRSCFEDLKSGITFCFEENSVLIRKISNIKNCSLVFWSSIEKPLISDREPIRFIGYQSYDVIESKIYDGIYNKRKASQHIITFQDRIEMRFTRD